MNKSESAYKRERYDRPPECPDSIQEGLAAKAILLVELTDGDIDERRRTHRVASEVKALHRMTYHNSPNVGEECVSRNREHIEGYK